MANYLTVGVVILGFALTGCNTTHLQTRPAADDSSSTVPATHPVSGDQAALSPADNTANQPDSRPATGDVWNRLRGQFSLKLNVDHPSVKRQIDWYARNQEYLDRVVERARPYLYFITEEIERAGIPAEMALLPVVESAYQPFAYSHGRAAGIWQFIPYTGKRYGMRQTWWYDGRRDIYASTKGAIRYLTSLNKTFKGDWSLALAAYNSGEATVARAIRKNHAQNKPTDFFSLKLPRETRGYVPKLMAIAAIVADPAKYGITLKPVPDHPYFTPVNMDSQIDLALAADLAGIDMEELYQLNPAFNRWATDPNGPHRLLLPVDKAEIFNTRLAELPKKERIHWVRHRIRNGETIGTIAQRYKTSTHMIRRINKIRGNTIVAGRSLTIPVATKRMSSYTKSVDQRLGEIKQRPRNGYKVDYVVKSGDTLWDISRLYSVSTHKLAKWNGMAVRDPLKTGQKLVIWTQADSKRSSASHFTGPSPMHTNRKINYVVRRGDSLAGIAKRFRVSVSELVKWNRLPRDKYLQPGQYIKLFIDITKQSGRS